MATLQKCQTLDTPLPLIHMKTYYRLVVPDIGWHQSGIATGKPTLRMQ